MRRSRYTEEHIAVALKQACADLDLHCAGRLALAQL